MNRLIRVDDPDVLQAAEVALRAGEAIVIPTDTVYGLAAWPESTSVLTVLKGRPEAMPIAVLVETFEQAASLADLRATARSLAAELWPGPLTIVAPRVDGAGTIGVRCPDHDFVRALAARVGPLAVTSANRHGEPTPATASEAAASLYGAVPLVIDGGRCEGLASTVVDATGPELTILRVGPITEEQIRAAALR